MLCDGAVAVLAHLRVELLSLLARADQANAEVERMDALQRLYGSGINEGVEMTATHLLGVLDQLTADV